MTNSKPTIHTFCRSCGCSNMLSILSLGDQYPSDFVDSTTSVKIPLELVLCNEDDGGCGLLQLKHTTPRDLLYRKYWFRSGINEALKQILYDITDSAKEIVSLQNNDIVLDIGCNDGTLLRSYDPKLLRVGFEPASNLVPEATKDTTLIINNYFNFEEFKNNFSEKKCKIITSIAMFYDLDDPNSFVNDVKKCLDENGIWILQMAYLPLMLEKNSFDNIGHEHIEYYSLKSLNHLIEKHGLTIFDVQINDVYGGSIRAYIKLKNNTTFNITSAIDNILNSEKELGLDKKFVYEEFASRVNKIKEETLNFLKNETENGKIIYGYGASTKGNTTLQFFDLNPSIIKKISDRDPNKWNKKTIGTEIPIISEEQARKDNPDYFLILPWHFVDYFKSRESDYIKSGGKFIVALPNFKVISK